MRSTGTSDRREAEQQLARVELLHGAARAGNLLEDVYRSLTAKQAARIPLKRAIDDWLDEARTATSPGTFARYQAIARGFGQFLKATDERPALDEITPDIVRGYLNGRRGKIGSASINLERRILSVFFTRCVRNETLRANPVLAVRETKAEPRAGREAFSLPQIRLLYEKAPTAFWKFMILGGLYSGQRLGDLVCLRWGSVDFGANVIRFRQRKTGAAVQTPMARPLRTMLESLHASAQDARPAAFVWPEQARQYEKTGSNSFSQDFAERILIPAGLSEARTHKSTGKGRNTRRQSGGLSFHSLRACTKSHFRFVLARRRSMSGIMVM
ncbi:MAG: tyrosine-type recombinase/integrase [Limisphaerales bacterium]